MLVRSFPQLESRIFWDSDNGGGTGGGDETFTKDQVEQMIQGRISKMKADNAALQKQLADSDAANKAKLSELEAQLAALKKPDDPPPSDLEGIKKLMESKHSKELQAINEKIAKLESEKALEKNRRMNAERDTELLLALRKAGCRPDAETIAKTHFIPSVSYDEEEERWVFNLKKGGTVRVEEGVTEEIPDFLKEPIMQNGGSGSSSGARATAQAKQLEAEKAQLAQLKERAASGRDDDVQKYLQKKRMVGQLEQQLASK